MSRRGAIEVVDIAPTSASSKRAFIVAASTCGDSNANSVVGVISGCVLEPSLVIVTAVLNLVAGIHPAIKAMAMAPASWTVLSEELLPALTRIMRIPPHETSLRPGYDILWWSYAIVSSFSELLLPIAAVIAQQRSKTSIPGLSYGPVWIQQVWFSHIIESTDDRLYSPSSIGVSCTGIAD